MAEQDISESSSSSAADTPKKSGGGCLKIFMFGLILFMAALFGGLEFVKYYSVNCQGMVLSDCLLKAADDSKFINEAENTAVKAVGPYTYDGHTVSMELNIPLDGGSVTGTVTGECHGKAKGTYDGKDMGGISGTLTGYCDLAIIPVPAKATFQGTVNKTGKQVPISFDGSATGFTHSGSLSLSY